MVTLLFIVNIVSYSVQKENILNLPRLRITPYVIIIHTVHLILFILFFILFFLVVENVYELCLKVRCCLVQVYTYYISNDVLREIYLNLCNL